MARKQAKLSWNGSCSAQAEYEAAVAEAKRRTARRLELEARQSRKASPPSPTKPEYHAYLRSSRWKRLRRQKLESVGGKCEVCGSEHGLHVHHLHYRRIMREKLADLRVLCSGCHANQHEEDGRGVNDPLTRRYLDALRSS